MAFLKTGPIHGQNEEDINELQKEHLAHLTKMYDLGYADISGPFGDKGHIRGITIYNVPTLKMADSLAKSDPMVKAGRLEIEIHPWWAAKGFSLLSGISPFNNSIYSLCEPRFPVEPKP